MAIPVAKSPFVQSSAAAAASVDTFLQKMNNPKYVTACNFSNNMHPSGLKGPVPHSIALGNSPMSQETLDQLREKMLKLEAAFQVRAGLKANQTK